MKLIMEQYGRFIMTGVIVVAVFIALFFGVTDGNGHRGFLQIFGAQMDTGGIDYSTYRDYGTLTTESLKTKPEFTCALTGNALTGTEYDLSSLIKATDYDGADLSIAVEHILDEHDNEVSSIYDSTTGKVNFPEQGIYTFEVRAVDGGNRSTKSTVRIPVNKQ